MRGDARVLVVVGAQKARTSTISTVLERLPGVYFHHREIAAFEYPYTDEPTRQRFVDHLGSRPESVVGFKRADLLGRWEAPRHLSDAFGERLDVAVSLRHPVDRAVSAYFWYVRQGLVPPLPASVGLRAVLDRGEIAGFPRSGELLVYGRYADGLRRFADHLDARRIHVQADDRWDGPALAALLESLGVRGVPDSSATHEKRGVYSARRAAFVRVSMGGSDQMPAWDGRYADGSLRLALRRKASEAVDQLVLRRVVSDDELPAELLDDLAAYFEDTLEALREQWGVTLVSRLVPGGVGSALVDGGIR